jgi:predicted small metal-binding protein
MAKVFNCKDFGGLCNWKGRAETREELLEKIAKHGAVKHNLKEMSETMLAKITAAIRDEKQDFKNLKSCKS